MTKIIYICDTHAAAEQPGYFQQKPYPEKLAPLLKLLDRWISERGDINLIVHGGDMVDKATTTNIRNAAALFQLSIPLCLCLGNHDLTAPNALDLWLDQAPQFFRSGSATYSIHCDDCILHVVPNQWCSTEYFWESEQDCRLTQKQTAFLEDALRRHPDRVHLLFTHSAVFGVPAEQTGFTGPIHEPGRSFSGAITGLACRYPQLKSVFSGHSHINTHSGDNGAHYVTASSFTEAPFEFKLIEAAPEKLRMTTITLGARLESYIEYDFNKTYVQGRALDREFEVDLL